MIDLTTLKTEILNDPNGYGYAGKTDVQVADLLNLKRAAIQVSRGVIAGIDFLNAVADADFTALTAAEVAKLQMILMANNYSVDTANMHNVNLMLLVFTQVKYPTTYNLITNNLTRNGSRAEQLFGLNLTVSYLEIGQARLIL